MNRSSITQRGLVLLLVVSTFCPALYAGFKPEQHVIVQSEINGPWSVYAADLDGDGDLDVLSASQNDDKIAWYANDGTGQFGLQQVITTAAHGAQCVYAADLDGDGDLDVLSASYGVWTEPVWVASKIAWYANDGNGHFGPQQVITTEAYGAHCVYAADLDGDGDMDVLSASYADWLDPKIAWYANDGKGHFGPQQVITTEADGAICVYAADLDGDGDLDVLSASFRDGKIAWYANTGTGLFGPEQVITTAVDGATCVYAADLDGDDDLDVLSASEFDDQIAWYANDARGHFGPQQVITTEAKWAKSAYAADLDGDGDLDVLSASVLDHRIAWYANDGTGQFGPQQVITTAV
ncbi:MAG: VCBS repeat-containing protein, partial [Sedimentisphaerales bacterium]|nr:VCBS repeat-containing protein [Sedimentisphaerales bacterium]